MSYYQHGKHPIAYALPYIVIYPDETYAFEPNTPPEIKERFLKDYAEHLERKRKEQEQGIVFSDSW